MTDEAPSRLQQLQQVPLLQILTALPLIPACNLRPQQVDDVHTISKRFVVPAAAKQAFVSARVAQLMPEIPQQPLADDPGHALCSQ